MIDLEPEYAKYLDEVEDAWACLNCGVVFTPCLVDMTLAKFVFYISYHICPVCGINWDEHMPPPYSMWSKNFILSNKLEYDIPEKQRITLFVSSDLE